MAENKKENKTSQSQVKGIRVLDLAYMALFAALMAICSWITIPSGIPFTLQTFGVFMAVALLGGKRGTISISLYVLMGIIGLPVYSGFKAGVGHLLGMTGGYIWGFIASALVMWAMMNIKPKNKVVANVYKIFTMLVGLFVCYALGTAQFMYLYLQKNGAGSATLAMCLGWCVIPYILPDCIKIALAFILSERLKRYIPE